MAPLTRRQLLGTSAGLAAWLVLPADELAAQGPLSFTPLELHPQGRRLLNPQVSALDEREDALLDELLASNTAGQSRYLSALDHDFDRVLVNPGNPIGFQVDSFRAEGLGCRRRISLCLRNRWFGWNNLSDLILLIDSFVGHWYPCNDILEIGTCQRKLWRLLNGNPNPLSCQVYLAHLRYEMQSLFQYHGVGGPLFPRQSVQLVQRWERVETLVTQGNFIQARSEFTTCTVATDLLFRRYYPQWC